MSPGRSAAAAGIVRACRRLDVRGLIAGYDGNVSVRLEDGTILATPSGVPKGDLHEDDLVILSADGATVQGARAPSSEIRMHLHLYSRRSDVGAVVHAHPPHATAFAVAGVPLDASVLPELVLMTGPIPLVPYAQPGTDEVPARLDPFVDDHDAFLLAHHGATTVGSTLGQAMARMESLEHGAHIIAEARRLGPVSALPRDAVAALERWRAAMRSQRRDG